MAAPASLKQFDYGPSHKYKMNNSLTDKTDDILEAQGVGMLKRKAITVATVTVVNKHFKDANGIEIFESKSSAAGIPGAVEICHLDGKPYPDNHSLYGNIIETCSRKTPAEINNPYLYADFDAASFDEEGKLFYCYSESDPEKNKGPKWQAEVVSGFRMVDGIKRWVRTNHFICPEKQLDRKVTLFYDYIGEA